MYMWMRMCMRWGENCKQTSLLIKQHAPVQLVLHRQQLGAVHVRHDVRDVVLSLVHHLGGGLSRGEVGHDAAATGLLHLRQPCGIDCMYVAL